MNEDSDMIDWSGTTWEGSRREQLRRWSALTMDEILAAQEEMGDQMRATIERRRSQNLRTLHWRARAWVNDERRFKPLAVATAMLKT